MLLPFAGWAVTGAIFFIKPGYGPAYESLSIKTYPLDKPLAINPEPAGSRFAISDAFAANPLAPSTPIYAARRRTTTSTTPAVSSRPPTIGGIGSRS